MSLKSKKILGISITTSSKKEILEFLNKGLENTEKNGQKIRLIVTPNPEQVVLARTNSHFADILNRADVAIPDGIGLVWGSRILYPESHLKRITGIEFMEDLVKLAAKERIPIGLIGGRGGVAVQALECLRQKYPRVLGWAMEPGEISDNGYKDYNFYNIYKKIEETRTQIVFVGLGAPKQEYFMHELRIKIYELGIKTPIVFMSVGGAFDEISGRLPMTPKFIERYGLKWLWRLILEPWRWKRQLALFEFIFLVFKEKLRYDKKV
ncbi:WecB/TagA/CpsF family glycosyltransferase [Candidatus Gottesmanbacteria bacterium]|nr:WecB/TagA/CpsF family glycosyltransferase [Candidatus Gottesmanbacteria bacterium]